MINEIDSHIVAIAEHMRKNGCKEIATTLDTEFTEIRYSIKIKKKR